MQCTLYFTFMSASQKLDQAGVPPGAEPPAPSGGRVRAALTLGSVLLGYLIVPMAMSGTSVALPRIAADLGGSGGDQGRSVGVDAAGFVYVTGYTHAADFPVTPGAAQPTCGGCDPAVIYDGNRCAGRVLALSFSNRGGDHFLRTFQSQGFLWRGLGLNLRENHERHEQT